MKHIWFPGMAAVLGGALFCVYTAQTNAAQADALDERLIAAPTPQTIHTEVDGARSAGAPLSEPERQTLFAKRFTERIRGREVVMAVLVRFVTTTPNHTIIKLMCPARMEPWNMDRVAVQVWREAKSCLGRSYDVDLYETYIGAAPRKSGELRCAPDKAALAVVSHLSAAERARTPLEIGTHPENRAAQVSPAVSSPAASFAVPSGVRSAVLPFAPAHLQPH